MLENSYLPAIKRNRHLSRLKSRCLKVKPNTKKIGHTYNNALKKKNQSLINQLSRQLFPTDP